MLNSMIYRFFPAVLVLFAISLSFSVLLAQNATDDPVLFSIGDDVVHLSEFSYVYEKSNADVAKYDEKSVREFLDLYQKFKLKVADARAQGMDQNDQLESELAVYRNQLADKYMSDEAILDRMTKELYDRMKWNIDISHILRLVPEDGAEVLSERAIEVLETAKKEIESGENFEDVARKYSQDRSVLQNHGHLGYRRAKLPSGMYELETLMYSTPVGEVAGPVRTNLGYHLIKVNGRIPDPGTIEVAHILIRKPMQGSVDTSKQVIEKVYQMLQNGADFGEMVEKYSEDKNNNRQQGYLGKFQMGKYTPEFEEAAFAIEEDGGISPPVQTSYGWHIIQRISLDTMGSYESERRYLENLVRSDDRYNLAQDALVARVKEEENYRRTDVTNDQLLEILTKDVFQVNWEVPEPEENPDLFYIGEAGYDLQGFLDFLSGNLDARYQGYHVRDASKVVGEILENYVTHEILKYEKAHLEEKYPEFREIMREYREGIMLFEISKEKIWDRAGQDTAGLRAYYRQHRSEYHTPRQIEFNQFQVNTTNPRVLKKVERLIRKKSPAKVLKKLNKAAEVVSYEPRSLAEGEFLDRFQRGEEDLTEGSLRSYTDQQSGSTWYGHVLDIGEGTLLDFEEARGTVMSDYQKYLEEQWVAQLKKKYDIEINETVLESIIRS